MSGPSRWKCFLLIFSFLKPCEFAYIVNDGLSDPLNADQDDGSYSHRQMIADNKYAHEDSVQQELDDNSDHHLGYIKQGNYTKSQVFEELREITERLTNQDIGTSRQMSECSSDEIIKCTDVFCWWQEAGILMSACFGMAQTEPLTEPTSEPPTEPITVPAMESSPLSSIPDGLNIRSVNHLEHIIQGNDTKSMRFEELHKITEKLFNHQDTVISPMFFGCSLDIANEYLQTNETCNDEFCILQQLINFMVACALNTNTNHTANVVCGGTISKSGTYFNSPSSPYNNPGLCPAYLEPPEGTYQIKIELEKFYLMGPIEGDCTNDTFVVTGNNPGTDIPVICGENSGQHMYIDIDNSDGPYLLMVSTSVKNYHRDWKIKVTYLMAEDDCAPSRCLQYHTETNGYIESFAFPTVLNNQKYAICFGYVSGYCDIGLDFNRFDLGNINGDCTNDWLAVGTEKLCGIFEPLTAKANSTAGPIVLTVKTDDNGDNVEEGFSGKYTMMGC